MQKNLEMPENIKKLVEKFGWMFGDVPFAILSDITEPDNPWSEHDIIVQINNKQVVSTYSLYGEFYAADQSLEEAIEHDVKNGFKLLYKGTLPRVD